jgi:hypothetical protein
MPWFFMGVNGSLTIDRGITPLAAQRAAAVASTDSQQKKTRKIRVFSLSYR